MKPNEKTIENPESRTRRLVSDYAANGSAMLGKLGAAEILLLLSAKQLHLARVADRCELGEGLHVNVPLKRLLERDVKEIGGALPHREMLDELVKELAQVTEGRYRDDADEYDSYFVPSEDGRGVSFADIPTKH
ncbi:MAG: hypothetical protein HY040_07490 [Planctomycetes bacterium]|nr:hypothetical protein [Planctomycetota bacterium]